jgi:hypothetical protein
MPCFSWPTQSLPGLEDRPGTAPKCIANTKRAEWWLPDNHSDINGLWMNEITAAARGRARGGGFQPPSVHLSRLAGGRSVGVGDSERILQGGAIL